MLFDSYEPSIKKQINTVANEIISVISDGINDIPHTKDDVADILNITSNILVDTSKKIEEKNFEQNSTFIENKKKFEALFGKVKEKFISVNTKKEIKKSIEDTGVVVTPDINNIVNTVVDASMNIVISSNMLPPPPPLLPDFQIQDIQLPPPPSFLDEKVEKIGIEQTSKAIDKTVKNIKQEKAQSSDLLSAINEGLKRKVSYTDEKLREIEDIIAKQKQEVREFSKSDLEKKFSSKFKRTRDNDENDADDWANSDDDF